MKKIEESYFLPKIWLPVNSSVADPERFDADPYPDSTFHADADPKHF